MLKCATDLIATIVVLPDCIDRRNLVIASRAKQSRAAGQRRRWARDCFVPPPLAISVAGRAPRWSAKRSRSPRSGFGTHSEGPVSGAQWWTTANEDTAASKAEAALGEQRNTAHGDLAGAQSLSPAALGLNSRSARLSGSTHS